MTQIQSQPRFHQNNLTKFHKDWMKTATSTTTTNGISGIKTIFKKRAIELREVIVGMESTMCTINILTKFHKDWMKTETSIINILTKFHKDWMKTQIVDGRTHAHTQARTHMRTPDIARSHKLTMSLNDR
ncbi:hypothetical protein DPMN_150808 [Dreissena polymorpha]|uniref:Uncharacterized protein n=1 Tax=Dreissena polymorpha TaxID=45954 RepID=A0A9D4FID1_DREPO|nr:hypothetical protein DPMN_150808 [Dreissena polymorpha]